MDKMICFKNSYLKGRENESLRILDIGGQDVNGSYRPIFEQDNWHYLSADMQSGTNVDIVLGDPYKWRELKQNSFDVLISGQAFEHIEMFWITILEVTRVLKTGGLSCIIAPAGGFEHRYPVDCWRFYPDGFSALARFANLEVLEVSTQWESLDYPDGSDKWQDSVLIAKKPKLSLGTVVRNRVRHWALHSHTRFK